MPTTLYDILTNHNSFSCELFGEFDSECSFEWGSEMSLTEDGYEEFKDIMDLPVHFLSNGNIQVNTASAADDYPDDYLDEEVNRFVVATAGFVSADDYDRWFSFEEE